MSNLALTLRPDSLDSFLGGDHIKKKFDNQINYYTSLKSQIKPKNLDGDNN